MLQSKLIEMALDGQRERIDRLKAEVEQLQAENKALKDGNKSLWEVLSGLDKRVDDIVAAMAARDDSITLFDYKFGEGEQ